MATLVFTAIGTAIGGPLGGALGSLIGTGIDRAVIGGSRREGPRLKELAVTTSSYGMPIPRHFGTMRAAGTIVWATDLVESSERSGGGKGRPATTSYSYSASFAVAVASRPIRRLGRIWADGKLLRGAAGDLKVGGALRVYLGHGDQPVDPLIASDRGAACPAFRGTAYCVFEGLQLAEYGNRIPALSFEIVADEGEVTLAELLAPLGEKVAVDRDLPGLIGFSDEGGPLAQTLEMIGEAYPLAVDASGETLAIRSGERVEDDGPLLPAPAVDASDDGFGAGAGYQRQRRPAGPDAAVGVRYYDVGRDYQAGLQRAEGRALAGRSRVVEFPGAMSAATARGIANAAAERARGSQDTLAWRVSELDPAIGPGRVVRVPGQPGAWRIDGWEWCQRGVELELRRLPRSPAREAIADPGDSLPAPDLVAAATELLAFELPWDGAGDTRRIYAAASSASAGWRGAALYSLQGANLVPIGSSGARRCVTGSATSALAPSSAMLFDRASELEIVLVSSDFALAGSSLAALAAGANRALLGDEVIQFAAAAETAPATWRLRGLLRGRGGTEAAARRGHPAGTPFVLLDDGPVRVGPEEAATHLAAIGLADAEPVIAGIANPGLTLRPLTPVHPRVRTMPGGGITLQWTRRARGAWSWSGGVDAPLNEQREAYLVGLGDTATPALRWELDRPRLELSAATLAGLSQAHGGQPLWVRQIGAQAVSAPLLVTILA